MSIANSKWTKLVTGAIKFLPEAQWVGIVVELLTQLASSMGATSGDSKEALKHIEALHAEQGNSLSQITAAHAGLAQQIGAQSEALALHSQKLDALSAELHTAKVAVGALEAEMAGANARLRMLVVLAYVLLVAVIAVMALIISHR